MLTGSKKKENLKEIKIDSGKEYTSSKGKLSKIYLLFSNTVL